MIYCSKCGSQLTEGSVFCSKCGTRIESDSMSHSEVQLQSQLKTTNSKRKKSNLLVAIIITIIALAVSGGLLVKHNRDSALQKEETIKIANLAVKYAQSINNGINELFKDELSLRKPASDKVSDTMESIKVYLWIKTTKEFNLYSKLEEDLNKLNLKTSKALATKSKVLTDFQQLDEEINNLSLDKLYKVNDLKQILDYSKTLEDRYNLKP